MSSRILLSAASVAALLSTGLLAQTSAVLGPSNARFLEGLWRAGYADYADKLGQLVAASSLPEAEKKAVEAVHTRLLIAMKSSTGDAAGRRDLVMKVLTEKSAAMKAADIKSEAASQLVSEVVEQYRLLADALVEMIKTEQDPEKQATLRKDADATFKAAETEFEARKAEAEKLRSDDVAGSEIPLLVAFYGLGRLHYYHSLIHPADSLHAKHEIEVALTTLEEFDLDFSDSLAAYEAKLTQALCHSRLGKIDSALAACDEAIALRERFDKNKDGVYQVEKDAADVIATAVLQKALFLTDKQEHAKIVETCKQYFATVAKAMEAEQGPGVLVAMAKAHIALGENEPATKIAQQLIEHDPKGIWGLRGQQLMAEVASGTIRVLKGVEPLLRLAETSAGQGDYETALRFCREVGVRATAEEQKFAADAMIITGAIYYTRGWLHEAAAAWDALVRRYPKTTQAPDALWRQIRVFKDLDATDNTQTNKMPVYRRWAEEKARQLKSNYPDDPHVPELQFLDAEVLERANKFLDAVKIYEAIPAESTVIDDARYRAANCYQSHARSLANAGREKEAEPFTQKALAGYEDVLKSVRTRIDATNDEKLKQRLGGIEFGARVALANAFLSQARTADAENVIQKLNVADDDKRAVVVWALRIRTKVAQGAITEAADAMDAAIAKAAEKGFDQKSLLGTCRSLATSLDNQAVERSKKKEHSTAAELWKKAITFYQKSIAGASPADAAVIADRLHQIGLTENNVDTKVESWFEVPKFKPRSFEGWNAALTVYQSLQSQDALNYKGLIGYARVLGFLGKWADAEAELAKLFATEKIAVRGKLDTAAVQRKTELVTAYLEWAFALDNITGGEEKGRRAKATGIFETVLQSVPADSRYWWYSKYGQIRTYFERGDYDKADVFFKSVERTNPDFDGDRFGLKERFEALKTEIKAKVK